MRTRSRSSRRDRQLVMADCRGCRLAGAAIILVAVSGGRARVAGLPPANIRGPSGTGMALTANDWFMGRENGRRPGVQGGDLSGLGGIGFMGSTPILSFHHFILLGGNRRDVAGRLKLEGQRMNADQGRGWGLGRESGEGRAEGSALGVVSAGLWGRAVPTPMAGVEA
jgi:hypothetical protein